MQRSRAVDALRAVAVLMVLLHHLDIGPLVDGVGWLWPLTMLHELGFLGVSLFLVLSGFSIHLRAAAGGTVRARPFLLRRFVRLQPVYYVAFAFALVLTLVGVLAGLDWPRPRWGGDGAAIPVWLLLVTHLTLLPATVVPPSWMSISWSLALEEQLYLLYAAVVGRMRRVPAWRWLLAAVVACLVFRVGAELVSPSVPKSFRPVDGQWPWWAALAFQQVPARMAEWFTGAFVAEWWAGRQRLPRLLTGPVTAAGLLGLMVVAVEHRAGWTSLAGHRFAVTDVLFDPLAGLAFGALLLCCLAAERRAYRPADLTVGLAWLGERSYSFYLVHGPIVGLTFALAAGRWRPAVAVLAAGLSLAGACLLYRYVEAPFAARSKKVGRADPTGVVPRQREAAISASTPR